MTISRAGSVPSAVKTWIHPKLGRFRCQGDAWGALCRFTSFMPFGYRESGRPVRRAWIPLEFETDFEESPPSPTAVAIATRLFENQSSLADKLLKAMWLDLQGRGPHSGMWWHGDLCAVRERLPARFEKRHPSFPVSPADLQTALGVRFIEILKLRFDDARPVAKIVLFAAYEREHGVAVLTDGKTILGIGYQSDTGFFRKPRKKKPGGTPG